MAIQSLQDITTTFTSTVSGTATTIVIVTTTSIPNNSNDNNNNTNNGGGGNTINPGSSIPFSFLIAFIALFLFFLGCGIGTRRVAFAIRRSMGIQDEFETGGRVPRRETQQQPVLHDVWPKLVDEYGEDNRKWESLQPLSISYVREQVPEEEEPPSLASPMAMTTTTAPISHTPPTGTLYLAQTHLPMGVRPSTTGLFPSRGGRMSYTPALIAPTPSLPRPQPRPPPPPPSTAPQPSTPPGPPLPIFKRIFHYIYYHRFTVAIITDLGFPPPRRPGDCRPSSSNKEKPVEALQVNILIAMPSPERHNRMEKKSQSSGRAMSPVSEKGKEVDVEVRSSHDEEEELGEYVIGTTSVVWEESRLEADKV